MVVQQEMTNIHDSSTSKIDNGKRSECSYNTRSVIMSD